jgi:hypothetical protein
LKEDDDDDDDDVVVVVVVKFMPSEALNLKYIRPCNSKGYLSFHQKIPPEYEIARKMDNSYILLQNQVMRTRGHIDKYSPASGRGTPRKKTSLSSKLGWILY